MAASEPIIIDRYALFGAIARGGMASVHLGRLVGSAGFVRTVAIKRLHAQYAAEHDFVSMFVDEARLAARITHPNVVQTLDVVHTEDELFIVMELVNGEALSRLLRRLSRRGEAVPPRYALPIVAGVLHGLHAAHTATNGQGQPMHIVHRDVSPQNILVGTDGVARVFDFGIAKARGRLHTTQDGAIKGKLPYMAREQLSGGEVGPHTDVYAAGVVLWEMLAGRRMFRAEFDAELFGLVMEGCTTPPSAFGAEIPPELDRIVMKALCRDYKERYPSARAMASELEDLGNFALASELGSWVEEQAQDSLAERSRVLARIESQPSQPGQAPMAPARLSRPGLDADPPPDDGEEHTRTAANVTMTSSPEPRRLSWVAAGLLLIALVGLVIYFGFQGGGEVTAVGSEGEDPAMGADVPEPEPTPDVTATASAAPTTSASAGPEPTASATTAPSAPPRGTTPPRPRVIPRPRPTGAPQPAPPPPKNACNPPHYYDSDGIKHLKPQCL